MVAGIRITKEIDHMADEMPQAYEELQRIAKTLEKHYRDMQDLEFTIEKGNSGCCKPATANAPPRPPCASQWTWPKRA